MTHDERFNGPSSRPLPASRNAHRAALEALFAPKPAPAPPPVAAKRDSAKMVTVPARGPDARADERAALLDSVLAAAGRSAVSRAVDAMRLSGFELPEEQEAQLQLLEHADEERVREAMLVFARLLETEMPRRRTVLDSRLRRVEECADEASTRELATTVRRKLAPAKPTQPAHGASPVRPTRLVRGE